MTENAVALAMGLVAGTLVGVLIGRWMSGRRNRVHIEAAKLATLKATMRTVQLVVNNFFNHLLMVELEIKDQLRPRALDQLERRVQETFQELKALGDVWVVEEVPFALGPLISYPKAASADQDLTNGSTSGNIIHFPSPQPANPRVDKHARRTI